MAVAKGKRKNPVKGKTLSVPQQLSWQVQSQQRPEVGHQGVPDMKLGAFHGSSFLPLSHNLWEVTASQN